MTSLSDKRAHSITKHTNHNILIDTLNQTHSTSKLNYYTNIKPTSQVYINSPSALSVYADTLPQPTEDDNMREGWLHTKIMDGPTKFNYYYYGEANHPVTLGELKGLCANVSVDKWDNYSSVPFFNVYTKMTGSGDAGSWYHSRITYSLDSSSCICIGEHVELWAKNKPTSYNGLRQVELKTKTITGSALDSEEIYTISLGSDSASAINTKILVSSLGFDTDKIQHRVKLVT